MVTELIGSNLSAVQIRSSLRIVIMMERVRSLFSPRRENSKQINCRRPGPQIRRRDLLRRSADFHRVYTRWIFKGQPCESISRSRKAREINRALSVPPRIV